MSGIFLERVPLPARPAVSGCMRRRKSTAGQAGNGTQTSGLLPPLVAPRPARLSFHPRSPQPAFCGPPSPFPPPPSPLVFHVSLRQDGSHHRRRHGHRARHRSSVRGGRLSRDHRRPSGRSARARVRRDQVSRADDLPHGRRRRLAERRSALRRGAQRRRSVGHPRQQRGHQHGPPSARRALGGRLGCDDEDQLLRLVLLLCGPRCRKWPNAATA